ncbi:hypothetical protein SLEP1_g52013 [Rubroshorea leprosula]|uniref:Ankyrin repeat protein n=1 Tax=Rubroshorea leprosula TaxID=152421 RepID=A0AAV5M8D2_9ROSI|nr:hypothetical protein SLEP1_g52013 [Rubroshorea leprosula]
MDRRLQEIVLRWDTHSFLKLAQEQQHIIKETATGSLNTILHLAASFGHVELVAEIVKLWPEMVGEENERMEKPLPEACREGGRMEIVRLLVETDPWLVNKVNRDEESALLLACEPGRADVVKHLLFYYPWMLMLEVDALTTSLHVTASSGYTEVVKELPQLRRTATAARFAHRLQRRPPRDHKRAAPPGYRPLLLTRQCRPHAAPLCGHQRASQYSRRDALRSPRARRDDHSAWIDGSAPCR